MELGDPSTQARRDRILAALLSDRGIKHLVDEAAEALGNPIVVVDPSQHYVASSGVSPAADDDSAYARVMREEMAFGDILEDGVAFIEDDGINERLARSRGPVVRDNANLGLTTMTQNVMVHGICLARVMMMAHERPFAEGDVKDFSLLCNVVGQELQKGEVFTAGSAQMESYFLRRLLEDEQPTPQATARRLALLGLEPQPTLFVVVVRDASTRALSTRDEESLRGQLQPMLVKSLATSYGGDLVIVASRAEGPFLTPYDRKLLARVAKDNDVLVGVSNAFDDLCDVRRHLAQARSAIHFGSSYTKVLDDTHVYNYYDYTYMELLDFANDRVNLLNYVHPAIWALYDHDLRHGSELVETLYAYMQNGCSTARTALLLCLHKNTLLYRLGRIKEICDNDLTSGEDLFLFHLSIRALLYLGLLETRTKPRTSDDLRAHHK